jgi:FHA domain-containing protein
MKPMDDYIDVTVVHDGREVANGRYKLPFMIGRAAGQNSIRVGESDKSISGTHARVEAAGSVLRLTDLSLNGTTYRDRRLNRGEAVELHDGEAFGVRDYLVRVKRAKSNPNIPTVFDAQIYENGVPRILQPIGEMFLLFVRTRKGVWFDPIPASKNTDFDLIVGTHKLAGELPFAVLAAGRGGGILLLQRAEKLPNVLLNRRPLASAETPLSPLDVIQVGDARIELLVAGERSLKCSNASCELLNPYDHRGFCRFCGFRLVEAETRMSHRS